mmetsp:Transcript_31019/g.77870  ORF Transcript_31019/g.77870 Transcript_31019/m.77870 type:complete len:262 (-) Transcript_31019:20-805(-)
MKFRPSIDLRDGRVTQIVGGTLSQDGRAATTNFVTDKKPAEFAALYKKMKLPGGHVIMLGQGNETAALEALAAFPNGLQVGGGITPHNAQYFLDAGASHIIVTSYIFNNGEFEPPRLEGLSSAVGPDRIVLDLSCRKAQHDGRYYVVCNKWQSFTTLEVSLACMRDLSRYCAEFLIHGVDVEGKRQGIQEDLIALLGEWQPQIGRPITYAGGVRNLNDVALIRRLGRANVDYTVGSALDIFGGDLPLADILSWQQQQGQQQ